MRIVGGSHRGRRLVAPPGETVRPTSDRAREALFNILSHGAFAAEGVPFAEKPVLDAFAGTGALGLEALSRGASEAVFIENDREALIGLRRNIAELDETTRSRVIAADATRPPRAPVPCAVAFLDPPYASGLAEPALSALAAAGWLLPDALAVAEVGAREPFTAPAGFHDARPTRLWCGTPDLPAPRGIAAPLDPTFDAARIISNRALSRIRSASDQPITFKGRSRCLPALMLAT